ncbi:T9SS type A sorting domain-containing protein [Mucilaginibacter psychrotolerans]|uniref:T9SS type A sorting domain-containing protein n=1 Tax=Mucilaginibacter psychrotolerans TaxID=1524096 RepID=A0A4Y8S3K3_9SPHI|nr:T9SS type A sorting domain-containing protein [Mucilaginibacter psychrotolerans]TFF33533.1 T9SS type A sorting domain-containing protein [Mucilaginibacter psychrotolerans]
MKKFIIHPRLEAILALSLVAIFGLPPLVLAQNTPKSIEIKITNGDTTVNGKDIKKLTQEERRDALGELDKMGNLTFRHTDKDGNSDIVIRRGPGMRGRKNNEEVIIERRIEGNMAGPFVNGNGDTIRKKFAFRLKKVPGDSTLAFNLEQDGPDLRLDRDDAFSFNDMPPMPRRPLAFDGPGRERMRAFDRKNSQTFNYSSTDNDGISTDVSFRVTDANKEALNRISGVNKAALAINDLNLSPEFSTGKTSLSFNLDAKTSADVKLTDSEGKALWSDKVTGGTFSKKISLPRNGIYFLTVKQGANVAVKRIVKE